MGAIAYKGKIYGGGGSVEDLTDVSVTNVADGDILEYDAESEEWNNSDALSNKVDKVTGKGLSTNDYTDEDKDLVATIPDKADSKDISGSKSVTGNPIIIEDSANAYAEKLIANIEPIQDLHGYDKPWVGGAGKNLAEVVITTETTDGVTYKANADGTISVSGTPISYAAVMVAVAKVNSNMGNVTVSGISNAVNVMWDSVVVRDVDNNVLRTFLENSTSLSGSVDLSLYPSADNIGVIVKRNNNNVACSGYLDIQVEKGSSATAFEPYKNECPITGITQLDIDGCGKNLLPMTVEGIKAYNNTATWTGNSCTINGVTFTILTDSANNVVGIKAVGTSTASIEFKIADTPLKNGVTYCISGAVSNPLDMNVTLFRKISDSGSGVLYTSDADENRRVLLYSRSADIGKSVDAIFKPMVCVSNVIDTDFVPYTSNNHTLQLGRTVYGGKLNVQTGELGVDTVNLALGTLSWTAYSSADRIYYSDAIADIAEDKTSICTSYKAVQSSPADLNNGEYRISTNNRIYIRDMNYSGAGAFKTHLTDDNVYATYKLATPITYHLTPEQVKLLKGYNYITTNADTLDIIYQPDNVLGEILMEAEGYTDRAIASISDKGAEPITHNIDISSYTDESNPYVAPEDGYVQLRLNAGGTGYIWLKLGYKRNSGAIYSVDKYFYQPSSGDGFDAIFVKKGTYICLSSIQTYTDGSVYFRY